mgnify:CR=1 FL=1
MGVSETSEQDAIFSEDNIGSPSDFDEPVVSRKFADDEDDPYFADMDDYFESQGTGDYKNKVFSTQYDAAQKYARGMGTRRNYGLENEKMYEYANRQAEIAAGTRKTAGEISAAKELAIMASGQRGAGRSRGRGSFDVAEALRLGGMSAQGVESEGGAMIGAAAEKAKGAAAANLEQLLITGQERSEDRKLAMQRLQTQQELASGNLWSNILSGVLGAVGTVVGTLAGGPAGGAVGGAIGSSAGSAGRYIG